jgi:hypothetical protein
MRKGRLMKKLIAGAFATAVSVGFATQSRAATLDELFLSQGLPANVFASDENAETLINRVGADNIIDVGDSIRGVISIDQLKVNASQQFALRRDVGNSEFGGIFQLRVVEKNPLADGTFQFVFGADSDFEAQYGTGTVLAMWEDRGSGNMFDVHDAVHQPGETPGAQQSDAETSVSDGLFFWTLGLVRPTNNFIGFGLDDVNTALNASTRLGESIFALDRTSQTFTNGGLGAKYDLTDRTNPAGTGEFIGTSQIGGRVFASPWPLSSETDVEFTIIPTPSALMGGLVLLGGVMLRRRFA